MQITLERACSIVRELQQRLRFGSGANRVRARLVPVGSLRRQEPLATDIDLLVVVADRDDSGDVLASAVLSSRSGAVLSSRSGAVLSSRSGATLSSRPRSRPDSALEIAGDRRCGPRRRTMLLALPVGGAALPVDLFLVRESELPFALFHYTGSRAYNIRTRAHAKRLGWTLNQYGLFNIAGRRVRGTRQIRTEAEVAARLGLSYRAATDRKK